MSASTFAITFAVVGLALALGGFFGPEDHGTLELVGLILIAVAVWKGWPQ